MSRKFLNKRIHGTALEQIMRDVLDGMQDITRCSGAYSQADELEILEIEKNQAEPVPVATIIPFPRKRRDS